MTTFDIRIQENELELCENWERVLQFDDNSYGYYCFLLPFLNEVAKQTNQFVEREGDAVYSGKTLQHLAEAIANAKASLEQKSEQWNELVFTRVSPRHELVYASLSKETMQEIIDTIETAIEKAKANNLFITFWD